MPLPVCEHCHREVKVVMVMIGPDKKEWELCLPCWMDGLKPNRKEHDG